MVHNRESNISIICNIKIYLIQISYQINNIFEHAISFSSNISSLLFHSQCLEQFPQYLCSTIATRLGKVVRHMARASQMTECSSHSGGGVILGILVVNSLVIAFFPIID